MKWFIKGTMIVGLCAGVLVLLYLWTNRVPAENTKQGKNAFSEEKIRIESFFQNRDAKGAYEAFKKENMLLDVTEAHPAAHVFGEVLYEKTGLAGFSVCDGDFGFGCFHSFIGRAITEHGPDVVRELDAACVRSYGSGGTGCFHGIGHGLLAYFGYGLADVNRALTLCDTLSWERPLGGCADGVFMEYNFRLMEKDPEARYRPFIEQKRYEPCLSIGLYSAACYFGLPAWWASALQDTSNLPARMGTFCSDVEDEDLRRACFRGIGYGIVPEVKFDVKAGGVFCDEAAQGSARVWCREGLAWAFYADPATRERALLACAEGLVASDALQCKKEYLFVIQ